MIDFETARGRFHLRAAGVAVRDGHVLLHRVDDGAYWILPGGRVELGETSSDALKREMREELSQDVEVGRLLWIVESVLEARGRWAHGLGLYYAMSFAPSSSLARQLDAFEVMDGAVRLSFAWHPLSRLATLPILPPFLREHLLSLPDAPLHLVDIREQISE